MKVNVGDEVEVFIFKDSKGRLAATTSKPLAQVGDIAYHKVVDNTEIGTFIDVGLPKDILVPFKEKKYPNSVSLFTSSLFISPIFTKIFTPNVNIIKTIIIYKLFIGQ